MSQGDINNQHVGKTTFVNCMLTMYLEKTNIIYHIVI